MSAADLDVADVAAIIARVIVKWLGVPDFAADAVEKGARKAAELVVRRARGEGLEELLLEVERARPVDLGAVKAGVFARAGRK